MKQILVAYTNGVNDFLEGIGYLHDEITAFYLPLEFWASGISTVEKWTIEDSLYINQFINFKFNNNQDLTKVNNILKQQCQNDPLSFKPSSSSSKFDLFETILKPNFGQNYFCSFLSPIVSNTLVLSGDITANGKAMVYTDQSWDIGVPSMWTI